MFFPLDREVCREKYRIKNDDFVLLWMGRISAYDKSDLFPLLHTLKRLKERNTQKVKFVIAGKDNDTNPHLPYLLKLCKDLQIEDSVQTILNFDPKCRNEIYNLADVFISPIDNFQETFGLTPIEAMCAGIPQIVSDWNGYKDTVLDGETGFRIPTYRYPCSDDIFKSFMLPSDSEYRSRVQHYMMSQTTIVDNEYIERSIQRLIDNSSLMHTMSENSIKYAKKFSWSAIMKTYNQLWNELADIAQSSSQNEENRFCDFHTLNYDKIFASYPTSVLSGDVALEITAQGIDYATNGMKMPLHYTFEKKLLHYNLQNELLRTLCFETPKCLLLSDIHKILFKSYKNKHVVDRCVMSLIKQGMLKIKETEGAL